MRTRHNSHLALSLFILLTAVVVNAESSVPMMISFSCETEGGERKPIMGQCNVTPICEKNGKCYYLTAAHCGLLDKCSVTAISFSGDFADPLFSDQFTWHFFDGNSDGKPDYTSTDNNFAKISSDVAIIEIEGKCPYVSPLSPIDPNSKVCSVKAQCFGEEECKEVSLGGTVENGTLVMCSTESTTTLIPGTSGAGVTCSMEGGSGVVACYSGFSLYEGSCYYWCAPLYDKLEWLKRVLPEDCVPKPKSSTSTTSTTSPSVPSSTEQSVTPPVGQYVCDGPSEISPCYGSKVGDSCIRASGPVGTGVCAPWEIGSDPRTAKWCICK